MIEIDSLREPLDCRQVSGPPLCRHIGELGQSISLSNVYMHRQIVKADAIADSCRGYVSQTAVTCACVRARSKVQMSLKFNVNKGGNATAYKPPRIN